MYKFILIFRSRLKGLTLNEILEELENNKDGEDVPSHITILPPENCNTELTDEDSGDENQVSLSNLPGSQLRAPATVHYSDDSALSNDSDDDMCLAQLAKEGRGSANQFASTSKGLSLSRATPTTQPTTSVLKTKTYSWVNRDIRPKDCDWKDKTHVHYKNTATYYFNTLFDDEVIDLFVQYTNLYASQKNKQGYITRDEMRCFFGILLYSGYVVVPRRYMYWETASDCKFEIVYEAMARDRFTYIMSHLHCCDNNNLIQGDKFAKIRPLVILLNKKFIEFAPFNENYSIDEAMVPYYGGHPCKQFIRGKPIRWGYKFWVGATPSGYIVWFDPYQGSGTEIPLDYRKLGLGASVVLRFADILRSIDEKASFHLFFDNFFTSVHLIDELSQRNLRGTGTVRENRVSKCPLPSNKEMQKTDRGMFHYRSTRAEEILVCKWHDNNIVTVVSNASNVLPPHKIQRFSQQQKKYIKIDQPAVIKSYNENMGGVDRSDQNIGLYRTSIRGKKWYFSLICHALDMALQNSWQLYKNNGGEHDHLAFRRAVATGIMESFKKSDNRKFSHGSKKLHKESRLDNKEHMIRYKNKQTRCNVCHKNAKFFCTKCKITLHPKDCFEIYHTEG